VPSASAPQGSNAAVKIIIAILAIFAFLALLVAGSCVYLGYRVRQKTKEFSQQMGGSVAPYAGKRQPCAMLSTSEASEALDHAVQSVLQRGIEMCEYRFGPGPGQRVEVEYTWEGAAMAMNIARGAMTKISGPRTFTPVQGIGDEAYAGPAGSVLIMRKGDVMVSIDLRATGVTVDSAKKMASKIADRL
jgi:hypothetical protein